jgi:hypothetical protein
MKRKRQKKIPFVKKIKYKLRSIICFFFGHKWVKYEEKIICKRCHLPKPIDYHYQIF